MMCFETKREGQEGPAVRPGPGPIGAGPEAPGRAR
jgi:hypothetical protein